MGQLLLDSGNSTGSSQILSITWPVEGVLKAWELSCINTRLEILPPLAIHRLLTRRNRPSNLPSQISWPE